MTSLPGSPMAGDARSLGADSGLVDLVGSETFASGLSEGVKALRFGVGSGVERPFIPRPFWME